MTTNTINGYNNTNNYINNNNMNSSLQKMGTGSNIPNASYNPASLAIANQLLVEGNAMGQSVQNTNSAVAMMQIADNAMDQQSNILDTVKTKLIQAGTDTTSASGRESILKDVQKLMEQFNNIASQTNYNGTSLLQQDTDDTDATDALSFQAGTSESDTIESTSIQSNTTGLGLDGLLNQDASTFTAAAARGFMGTVDTALKTLNDFRGEIGSTQNQLESATRNLMTQETNILAAQDIIANTDYAKESSNFSSQNVISQAGIFVMSQANATQQNVMRLLQ